jgi:hypothetical protein
MVLPHMKHHGQDLVEVAFPLSWVAAGAMAKDVSGRKDAFNTLLHATRRFRLFRPYRPKAFQDVACVDLVEALGGDRLGIGLER